MRIEMRRLSRETLIYGSGLLLARGIGFLLIPLYTRYLTPADYGVLDLIELASFILGYLFLLGIDEALLREYHMGTDPEQKAAVTATALWFSLGYAFCIVLLLLPFSTILTRILIGDTALSTAFALALIGMITGSAATVAKTALRAQQRSITYTTVSLVSTVLAVALNVFFLASLHLGVYGIVLSTLINSGIVAAWLFWDLLRPVGHVPRVGIPKLGSMLRYGLPFVPAALASFVVNWSDRYFLRVYSTLTTVGLYAFGYKLGMIVIFLVNAPFLLVWNSYLFEIRNQPNAKEIYARVATYYLMAICAVGLAIACLARQLVSLVASPDYLSAYTVVPIVTLAMVFLSANAVFRVGLLLAGRTPYLAVIKGCSAAVNIALNFLLIPSYGMMGAAVATAATFGLETITILTVSQRVYPIQFELDRLAKLAAVSLVIFIACWSVPVENLWLAIVSKAGILALFPVLLYVVRFAHVDESEYLAKQVRRLIVREAQS